MCTTSHLPGWLAFFLPSAWAKASNVTQGLTQGRAEGRVEGRVEGRAEEAARNLPTVLRVRGFSVPDHTRERILSETDPERLESWLEKAVVRASSSASTRRVPGASTEVGGTLIISGAIVSAWG